MKNILVLLAVFLLFSCSSSKSAADGPNKKTLKGTWEVVNIKFIGHEGFYKAFLFDKADSSCFKNSEWVFIPNNGSGKFATHNSNSTCEVTTNRIHWSFFESGDGSTQFQFKYVDEKNKPLYGSQGYRTQLNLIDESSMTLTVPTTHDGNPFNVIMTFNKISDDFTL